jgi:hypothetical protein
MNRIMFVLQCLLQIRSGGMSISDAAVSDFFLWKEGLLDYRLIKWNIEYWNEA